MHLATDLEYHCDMFGKSHSPSEDQSVDLAGLPDTVVWTIQQLVRALRVEYPVSITGPSSSETPEIAGNGPVPQFITRPHVTPEEMERLLDELASESSGKALPPDFSRADIYDDHD
jgi:hypothetical protein